jgi:hypothetical protein
MTVHYVGFNVTLMLQLYSITFIMTLCFAVQITAVYVHSSMTVVTFNTCMFVVIHGDIVTAYIDMNKLGLMLHFC